VGFFLFFRCLLLKDFINSPSERTTFSLCPDLIAAADRGLFPPDLFSPRKIEVFVVLEIAGSGGDGFLTPRLRGSDLPGGDFKWFIAEYTPRHSDLRDPPLLVTSPGGVYFLFEKG